MMIPEFKKLGYSKAEYKELFHKSLAVRLGNMEGEPSDRMPAGLIGNISFIDDLGQVHCKWKNGSTLALVPTKDNFEVLSQDFTITVCNEDGKETSITKVLKKAEN